MEPKLSYILIEGTGGVLVQRVQEEIAKGMAPLGGAVATARHDAASGEPLYAQAMTPREAGGREADHIIVGLARGLVERDDLLDRLAKRANMTRTELSERIKNPPQAHPPATPEQFQPMPTTQYGNPVFEAPQYVGPQSQPPAVNQGGVPVHQQPQGQQAQRHVFRAGQNPGVCGACSRPSNDPIHVAAAAPPTQYPMQPSQNGQHQPAPPPPPANPQVPQGMSYHTFQQGAVPETCKCNLHWSHQIHHHPASPSHMPRSMQPSGDLNFGE